MHAPDASGTAAGAGAPDTFRVRVVHSRGIDVRNEVEYKQSPSGLFVGRKMQVSR